MGIWFRCTHWLDFTTRSEGSCQMQRARCQVRRHTHTTSTVGAWKLQIPVANEPSGEHNKASDRRGTDLVTQGLFPSSGNQPQAAKSHWERSRCMQGRTRDLPSMAAARDAMSPGHERVDSIKVTGPRRVFCHRRRFAWFTSNGAGLRQNAY